MLKNARLRIAVVLVTHNRPELLRKALQSVLSQSRGADELVIVDNASDEQTKDVIRNYTSASPIYLDTNKGCSEGFAIGISTALEKKADWMLLIDDDAILEADVLQKFENCALGTPCRTAGLFAAVFENSSLALKHRRRFSSHQCKELEIAANMYSDKNVEIDEGSFVGFFLSAAAVHEVGLPLKEMFVAYDDTEYSLRLRRCGWTLYLCPKARVDHLRGNSGRLRRSKYGTKHYYHLRNQLATLCEYATGGKWRLALPVGMHLVLAFTSGGAAGLRLFWKALRDVPEMRSHIRNANAPFPTKASMGD